MREQPTLGEALQVQAAIDREILRELQADGRLSNVDLAERVHLSPSACLRRVKRLMDSGVIELFAAVINPEKLGQAHSTFLDIQVAPAALQMLPLFRSAPERVIAVAWGGSEAAGTKGSLPALSTSAGIRICARCGLAEARAQ